MADVWELFWPAYLAALVEFWPTMKTILTWALIADVVLTLSFTAYLVRKELKKNHA